MADYEVGYGKPPKSAAFVPNDPRSGRKPVGAKTRQTTRARQLLERAAKLPVIEGLELLNVEGEHITELDAVYIVQLAKARLGDKDAFKAVMDYAGFKPTEHHEVETRETDVFTSEQEELTALQMRLAALRNGEDETVEQAQAIVNAD